MTLNVGIIGGPGAGKTTTVTGVFSALKQEGINAALIHEFARDEINRGWIQKSLGDQFRILMKQRELEDIVPPQVKVKITDSPALLSYYYGVVSFDSSEWSDILTLPDLYHEFLKDAHRYDILILLKRDKEYINDGCRTQTEEESDATYDRLKALLDMHGIEFVNVLGDDSAIDTIFNLIMEEI
jgi:nicotinamide riboside kinase